MGVGYVMTSCQREDVLTFEAQHSTFPIEFSAQTDWKPIIKASLFDESELQEKGVIVWANWTKDPNDLSYFWGNYSSGSTNLVFGINGTKVSFEDGGWSYSPKQYWYRGTYNFAAAGPADIFKSSYPALTSDLQGVISEDVPSLNMQFGDKGFDLSEKQEDLVVAFATVDNKKDDVKSSVLFEMQHQLVLLNLKVYTDVKNTSFTIEKVEISGNHTVATQAQFTKEGDEIISIWNYDKTITKPFISKTHSWNVSTNNSKASEPVNLIENLIVFPEADPNKLVTIKIYCKETFNDEGEGEFVVRTGNVKANWQAGNTYTYIFSLDRNSILFKEPIVTPWNEGEQIGNITM